MLLPKIQKTMTRCSNAGTKASGMRYRGLDCEELTETPLRISSMIVR